MPLAGMAGCGAAAQLPAGVHPPGPWHVRQLVEADQRRCAIPQVRTWTMGGWRGGGAAAHGPVAGKPGSRSTLAVCVTRTLRATPRVSGFAGCHCHRWLVAGQASGHVQDIHAVVESEHCWIPVTDNFGDHYFV
jgi:hypothetical protein